MSNNGMTTSCCVCVNLSLPPWPEAVAVVGGYAGCAEHVQVLASHPQLGWACQKVRGTA